MLSGVGEQRAARFSFPLTEETYQGWKAEEVLALLLEVKMKSARRATSASVR